MLAQSVLDGYNVSALNRRKTTDKLGLRLRVRYDRERKDMDYGRWSCTSLVRSLMAPADTSQSESDVGMIPRTIGMIFRVSSQLKDRGWKYHMEGQFLEVYNEVVSRLSGLCHRAEPGQINDLLGTGQFDTKKHEIRHDKDGKMSVTDVVSGE